MTSPRALEAGLMALAFSAASCNQTIGFLRGDGGTDGAVAQPPDGDMARDGEAPPGDCGCPDSRDPLCGADGLTYWNPCELACAKQSAACQGECPCDCVCPTVFDPVCGSDGITYQNGCSVACAGVGLACDQECPCIVGDPCGGFGGLPCPTAFECLDDRSDACDPATGGSDCPGVCAPLACGDGIVEGVPCPDGYACVDDPGDGCDPATGLDCPGHCEPS